MRVVAGTNTCEYGHLTEGFEYAVYGVQCTNSGITFLILDDDLSFPIWCPSKDVICIDQKIPSDWVFHLHPFDSRSPHDWTLRLCGNDFFKFIMGPSFIAKNVDAYGELVEGYDEITTQFWKYVESQVEVSFIDEATALYVYDKRKMEIRIEKLSDGVILDADTIQTWLPPYQEENISDSEKELIQKRISDYLDRQGIVYGWI